MSAPAADDASAADAPSAGGAAPEPPETPWGRVARYGVPVLKVILVVLATWYLLRLVRRIDWPHVGASLAHLSWWQIVLLLAVVVLRQVLNAVPLALFVPGLGVARALTNDLSANLVGTIGPPPADLVLRMAMFQGWGINLASATSGLTLNMLTYYVARFAAPGLGFMIALVGDGYHPGYAWTALTSGAVAVLIVAGLVIVTRGERAAAAVGRLVGRAGHRVAPSRVDPDRWSTAGVQFQVHSGQRLRRSSGWVGLDLVGLLLVEGILLVICLRFVGVSAGSIPAVGALAILLVSYPLTALPFAGLGVLDTAITVVLAEDESVDSSAVVAALVIWRVCLLLVPLVLGGLLLLLWHRRRAGEAGSPPTGGAAAADAAGTSEPAQ